MRHPRDHLPALNRIEAALEATCGALITLEALGGDASDFDAMQQHVAGAVHSLREAIEELRSAQNNGANELALGFVLNGGPRAPRGGPGGGGQSKPCRTA